MAGVWIIGSVNNDLTYFVERLPKEGETVQSTGTLSCLGGKGSNQAAAASWSGAPTCLVGMTGTDDAASRARAELQGCGVDLRYLEATPRENTGSAVISVDAQGLNFILVHGGANRMLAYKPLPFAPGDYVAAQLETPMEAVIRFFTAAKEKNAHTVLNPSPYQDLPAALLAATDILVANEHEMESMTGLATHTEDGVVQAMQAAAQQGVARIVTTLGEKGALLWEEGSLHRIPGKKVQAVDTQGAGDAFMGVFVGMLAQGSPMRDAAEYANEIAAACVCTYGSTIPSLPKRK